MVELYSKPLSPEAREKLVDFIEAYIETLMVAEVDKRAEVAKQKAIDALNTDIDILAFITTSMTLYQAIPFMNDVIRGRMTPKQLAELVVEIAEKARKTDKLFRPGGGKS